MKADLIIHNIKTIYTPYLNPPVKGNQMKEILTIEHGFVAIKDGIILDFGNEDYSHYVGDDTEFVDACNHIMTPGLVDSHTHLVHFGSRENEFEKKVSGVPYLQILSEGGGILSTVESTRAASPDELFNKAKKSLIAMIQFGVTTLEAKSGYGLNKDTEIKQMEVAKRLNEEMDIDVISTYLGAHAYPPIYKDNHQQYIDEIKETMDYIDKHRLAEYVDVFCETGVFNKEETNQILSTALTKGFKIRLHSDEIDSIGGSSLGIDYLAKSIDHLMAITDEDIEKLSHSNTIATLLPSTSFYLNKKYANARKMIDKGVAVGIASDYNPGSSPSENFQFTMQLAGNKLGMTPSEILTASTINPAYSLDRADRIGSIQKGKMADLVLFDAPNLAYLIYHFGINHASTVFKSGKIIFRK